MFYLAALKILHNLQQFFPSKQTGSLRVSGMVKFINKGLDILSVN